MGGKRITTESFIERAEKIHGDKYDYSFVDCIHSKSKVKIICNTCNYIMFVPPNRHLSGHGCRNCQYINNSKNNKWSVEYFIEQSKKIHGNNFDYSKVNYQNQDIKIILICNKCNREFSVLPSSHLTGRGCKPCSYLNNGIKLRNTQKNFIERAKKIHNDKYDYSKVKYITCEDKVIIICKNCDSEFLMKPFKHLQKQGCKYCAYKYKSPMSKGEKIIENYLKQNNLEYEYEKEFDGCKFSNHLRFDFYLPKHNICIEYNGEQHYKIVPIFNITEKFLKDYQAKDRIKKIFCARNKIRLIIIPYTEYKNIKQILDKIFMKELIHETS